MKDCLRSIFFFLLIGMPWISGYGQDPHFSLLEYSQGYYSVSGTPLGRKMSSISLSYREQWTNVNAPFKTRAATFRHNFSAFGIKAGYWQNRTSDGGIRHTNMHFGANYSKMFSNHGLSVGLQVGLFQMTFDPTKLSFNSQYTAQGGYDPNLPSNEIFPVTNVGVADIATGMSYTYQGNSQSQLASLQVDFSVFHLTRPKLSFLNDVANPATQIPYKYVLTIQSDIRQNTNFLIRPSLLFERQGEHMEVLLGTGLAKNLGNQLLGEIGLRYRYTKALIPFVRVEKEKFSLGISYDFTQFDLNRANQGNGAFEIGLSYAFGKSTNKKIRPVTSSTADRDLDGIPDHMDKCPDIQGLSQNQGCPAQKNVGTQGDRDGDGILDKDDLCPLVPGLVIFRGCPDTDGDGIPDKQDKCPDQYGPKVRQGCPLSDIDADGDGTPDKIDQCPSVAGVPFLKGCPDSDGDGISDFDDQCPYIFGSAEFIGCPEDVQDADGDGIKNRVDKCPFIPGLASFQGCPDTDGDGIQDLEDACPMQKGLLANKGCPVETVVGTSKYNKEVHLFGPVEFDTDKAIVKAKYYQMLDDCIAYLKMNPSAQVQLAGHTDYEGNGSYNMVLSKNRSVAVERYLITRGIHRDRIEIVYFGENIPKANNGTFQGRAKNRRVEIVVND